MISVIVPVFNGQATIKRCIESILAQTLCDIEIIIVDDGSTDNTPQIINSIGDSRIMLIRQENQGQGAARNTGLSCAKGTYAAFVDADDTIEPQMLEKMHCAAEMYGCDIVQCNLTDIMPDGTTRTQLIPFEGVVSPDSEYMAKYMTANVYHSYEVCNKLFRMDFIKKNKLSFKDTKKYFSEDLLFNMEAVRFLHKICFLKEPYYNYYQSETSHLHSSLAMRAEKIERLFEYYAKKYPDMDKQAYYLGFTIQLWNIGACVKTDRKFAASKMKNAFMKKCISSVFKCKSSLKHKIYAIMARLPFIRLKAAELKFSR